jgi:RNA polymerase sigma factor (sigma-70 family)
MANGSLYGVLHYLRRLGLASPAEAGREDADLLRRFAAARDGDAFTTLVGRHGPLVWGVCTRMLGNGPDAEDAFQATFLVLARRAASVQRPELLAAWLFGVARRVAAKARGAATRHRTEARDLAREPAMETTPDVLWRDLRPVLDEEVGRLPEQFRVPFVLCHLEGLSNEEAARRLGCPRGTVLSRLARARQRLRDRLVRRGIDPSGAMLAAALAGNVPSTPVPPELVAATARLGVSFAAGAAPAVPSPASTLAEGVLHGMFLTQVKCAAAVLLALGLLGSGVGLLALGGGAPPAAVAREAPPEKGGAAAPAREDKPAAPEADKAEQPKVGIEEQAKAWRDMLARPIKFGGYDDPQTTLAEVLDILAARYGFQFEVNEPAFLEAGMNKVLATQIVGDRPIRAMERVTMATTLRLVLDRLPVPSTYVLRKDTIEITTVAAVRAELGVPSERPLLPLVWEEFDKVPLPAALRRLSLASGVNVVLDPRALSSDQANVAVGAHLANVPVDTAVRILANMVDLQMVRLDNVLYVTTPKRAAQLLGEHKRDPQEPLEPPARSPRQFGQPPMGAGAV